MGKKLTYQKKCILLGGIALLAGYYFFSSSFRTTWNLYRECSELERQQSELEDAPQRLQVLNEQLQATEKYMQQDAGIEILQHTLLEDISAFCKQHNLTLSEIPMSTLHEQDNYLIETCRLRIEGSFHPLLKMLYEVEKKYPGKTASAHFFTKKNYQRKPSSLSADFIFQHIKPIPYVP